MMALRSTAGGVGTGLIGCGGAFIGVPLHWLLTVVADFVLAPISDDNYSGHVTACVKPMSSQISKPKDHRRI